MFTLEDIQTIDKVALRASVCRKSFEHFVRQFWGQVPGAGKLVWNWHLSVLCELLQEVAERVFAGLPKLHDVCLNISPGTSKSSICSILFPAWVWTRKPSARIMTASHTDDLVLDLANKSRTVIKSPKYQRHFPEVQIQNVQDTKGYYTNTLGGDRKTCTVGGRSPMGQHADIIIIDDPIDPKKVLSEKEREGAKHFITNVIPTRKTNKLVTVTFLIMQRLGVDDPTDVMLDEAKKEGAAKVKHVCLPSELTVGGDGAFVESDVVPHELAKRYIDGLMDPARLGRSVLDEYRARGEHFYSTQFKQKTYVASGGMFHEHYFSHRRKAAPYYAKRVRYWDRASSDTPGACNTAGVLMAMDADGFYVEHVVAGKWEPAERNQRMRATALMDRARYGPKNEPQIRIEREGGSSGRDAWKSVAKALEGFPVFEDTVTGDKVTRAEPWSAQCAAGNVYLVEDGWDIVSYIREHCAFPNAPLKDRVDSSTGCFNWLIGQKRSGKGFRVLGNKKQQGLRILIGSKQDLANMVIGNPSILLALSNPSPVGNNETPIHGCNKLLDSLVIQFADMQPSENQTTWTDPIPEYDQMVSGEWQRKSAADLIMTQEHGKKLWAFLTKKRVEQYEVMVIVDDDDRRALSVAMAVQETLNQPLPIMSKMADEEWAAKQGDKAPNQHVYAMVRSTRSLVL